MSTHNIGFLKICQKLSFNYHQISSTTHLIPSSDESPLIQCKDEPMLQFPAASKCLILNYHKCLDRNRLAFLLILESVIYHLYILC